jgi:hypothetical protein
MLDPLCRMSSAFPYFCEIVFPGQDSMWKIAERTLDRVDTQSVTCYFQWS